MTTSTLPDADDDTLRVARPALASRNGPTRRLDQMDLDPPSGPVPAEVIAYFETAVARERLRRSD